MKVSFLVGPQEICGCVDTAEINEQLATASGRHSQIFSRSLFEDVAGAREGHSRQRVLIL